MAARKKLAALTNVTRDEAEEAVRTLLRWAGEDPRREGLIDTPRRVVDGYLDWFSGYRVDPAEYLRRTFEEVAGYDEMVVLRDIEFESHCEHHMAPIIGRAHVGYLPTGKVVGISKLARVVDVFARRFQVQEKMTSEIARCIDDVLQPAGVGVVIEAVHECMTTRGVHKRGVSMITSCAPMPFILSNSPSPCRSRLPSTRSTGNWFGITRSVQPGLSRRPPLRPCARSSGGVMCSCPSSKGHAGLGAIWTGSRRKSLGRLRRSVEMITHRPVTGSLRSSLIYR